MPRFLVALLLSVFVIHLGVFGWLLFRRRTFYYAALVFTFACLVTSFSLRLLGSGAHRPFRIAAWCGAAITLPLLGRRIYRWLGGKNDDRTGQHQPPHSS